MVIYTYKSVGDDYMLSKKIKKDEEVIKKRVELINLVSENFNELRIETGLKQDEMALILGISKNTIVNVESDWRNKDEIDNKRVFSWTVVISIIILFSNTETINNIIGDEPAIEVITNRAFCLNSSKKNMLSKNTITGLTSSITSITGLGNLNAVALLNLFNKGEKNK